MDLSLQALQQAATAALNKTTATQSMNSVLPAEAYKDAIPQTADVQSCCSGKHITCSSGEEFEMFSCSLR